MRTAPPSEPRRIELPVAIGIGAGVVISVAAALFFFALSAIGA
jgi:hypothetical protein